MLTKPKLNDQEIIQCLLDNYNLKAKRISFLPLGADSNTSVYRVTAADTTDYFLKLRHEDFCDTSLMVPKYLRKIGMQHIVTPIETQTGKLYTNLDTFKVALYPYIDGRNAVDTTLSEKQWLQLGSAIKKLHSTKIPKSIAQRIKQETFSSAWCEKVTSFLELIKNEVFHNDIAAQMAAFLKSKSKIIRNLIERIEKLRSILQNQSFKYVVCHADIHGWNLLIDGNDDIYLIDWDTVIFAPKERDLMFIGAGIWDSGYTSLKEESLFYKSYGETDIDQDAISYYRLERIIQDIGEYCEQIFLSNDSRDDQMQSFKYLQANFLPNGTVEIARKKKF